MKYKEKIQIKGRWRTGRRKEDSKHTRWGKRDMKMNINQHHCKVTLTIDYIWSIEKLVDWAPCDATNLFANIVMWIANLKKNHIIIVFHVFQIIYLKFYTKAYSRPFKTYTLKKKRLQWLIVYVKTSYNGNYSMILNHRVLQSILFVKSRCITKQPHFYPMI